MAYENTIGTRTCKLLFTGGTSTSNTHQGLLDKITGWRSSQNARAPLYSSFVVSAWLYLISHLYCVYIMIVKAMWSILPFPKSQNCDRRNFHDSCPFSMPFGAFCSPGCQLQNAPNGIENGQISWKLRLSHFWDFGKGQNRPYSLKTVKWYYEVVGQERN